MDKATVEAIILMIHAKCTELDKEMHKRDEDKRKEHNILYGELEGLEGLERDLRIILKSLS